MDRYRVTVRELPQVRSSIPVRSSKPRGLANLLRTPAFRLKAAGLFSFRASTRVAEDDIRIVRQPGPWRDSGDDPGLAVEALGEGVDGSDHEVGDDAVEVLRDRLGGDRRRGPSAARRRPLPSTRQRHLDGRCVGGGWTREADRDASARAQTNKGNCPGGQGRGGARAPCRALAAASIPVKAWLSS